MSEFIDMDFTDVPDKHMPLGAGIYNAEILGEDEDNEGPHIYFKEETPQKKSIRMRLKVVDEGENEGRMVTAFVALKNKVAVKRLVMSAGLPVDQGGVDLEELPGKIVKIKVTNSTYTDEASGEERIRANVDDFIPPTDD